MYSSHPELMTYAEVCKTQDVQQIHAKGDYMGLYVTGNDIVCGVWRTSEIRAQDSPSILLSMIVYLPWSAYLIPDRH